MPDSSECPRCKQLEARIAELSEWLGYTNPVECLTCECCTEEADEICHQCGYKRDGSEWAEQRATWTENFRCYPMPKRVQAAVKEIIDRRRAESEPKKA